MKLTEQEIDNIVEIATQTIVGDRQELTLDERNRITYLVAQMMSDEDEQEQ